MRDLLGWLKRFLAILGALVGFGVVLGVMIYVPMYMIEEWGALGLLGVLLIAVAAFGATASADP